MGHQDHFLAPFPGSVPLLVSKIGKETFTLYVLFLFFLLLLSVLMDNSALDSFLVGIRPTTLVVEKTPPSTKIVPYKILMLR